jgi:hypothetical protein
VVEAAEKKEKIWKAWGEWGFVIPLGTRSFGYKFSNNH